MSWLYSIFFAGLLVSSNGETLKTANLFDAGEPARAEKAAADETEVFERSYPLNPTGRVSVSNVNGSIVVEAWDRNEVKLTATKIGDSRETLADVEIKVDARPDFFSVEADHKDRNWRDRRGDKSDYNLEVQFKLSVPRSAVLNEIETVNGSVTVSDFVNSTKISSVNGNVSATNLRGAANLSTVNGRVIADFDRLETGTRINLSAVNGGVILSIPSDANATIKADSLNGNITNEFGLPVRKGEYIGRDLHGRLGSGDVQIKLDSVNGHLAVNRKKDGKTPNAPTNLLNSRSTGPYGPDVNVTVDHAKIEREVARAMRQADREMAAASKEAIKATEKLKVMKDLKVDIGLSELNTQISEGMKLHTQALVGLRDAMWLGGGPSIERRSKSFEVKGTPKVVVDAKNCSVRVRGWDKAEVKYVLTELSGRRRREAPEVKEEQNGSAVTLKVLADDEQDVLSGDGMGTRIEIFVPRKSNLKIISDGEIRLEGVSGEIDLDGAEGAIDVRESDGKLNVSNTDGLVRVVGFRGDLVARTGAGEVYLDGDFTGIKADANEGSFVLTLPRNADAEIHGPAERTETADQEWLTRTSENVWKLGKGGRRYVFSSVDGSLVIRNRELIAER